MKLNVVMVNGELLLLFTNITIKKYIIRTNANIFLGKNSMTGITGKRIQYIC